MGHAVHHGFVLLRNLIKHTKFPVDYADKILNCLRASICSPNIIEGSEISSISGIIIALMDKGVNELVIREWMNSLLPNEKAKPFTYEHYLDVRTVLDIKAVMHALYFDLYEMPMSNDFKAFMRQYVNDIWSNV